MKGVSDADALKEAFRSGKESQDQAGYLPPSQGPFRCGLCEYFTLADHSCEKVSGHIESRGCCNRFEKERA